MWKIQTARLRVSLHSSLAVLLNVAGSVSLSAHGEFTALGLAQFCRCKHQDPQLETRLHLVGDRDDCKHIASKW